jgi:hypothetical protein
MTNQKIHWPKVLRLTALLAVVAGVIAYGTFVWQENKAMDEMVSGGLTLINYTDRDVYASVSNAKYEHAGDGAAIGVGPHGGGGGLSCCVTIPARWRPGIKMVVWHSNKDWQPENGTRKIVELPDYPDGDVGDLYLIFYSETDFELVCSRYSPTHVKWPGRRVEKIVHGVQ